MKAAEAEERELRKKMNREHERRLVNVNEVQKELRKVDQEELKRKADEGISGDNQKI